MRAIWILLVFTACGSVDLDEYQRRELDAMCGYLVRCGAVSTVADCRDYYDYVDATSALPAAVESGKVSYDSDAAEACLDVYDTLSCDETAQPVEAFAACDDVFTGNLEYGETCTFSAECASEFCSKPGCTQACCAGTCEPPRKLPAAGEPCTSFCADEAFCGADSLCHEPLPKGAACDDLSYCARGLYCAGKTSGGSGTCTAVPHEGEACETSCAEVSSICVGGSCVAVGLLDDPCENDSRCASPYVCGANGTCSQPPALGEPCSTLCSGDAYCNDGTCLARKGIEATCMYSFECTTFVCDGGHCVDSSTCI